MSIASEHAHALPSRTPFVEEQVFLRVACEVPEPLAGEPSKRIVRPTHAVESQKGAPDPDIDRKGFQTAEPEQGDAVRTLVSYPWQ